MKTYESPQIEYFNRMAASFSTPIQDALVQLLTIKHLYQSQKVIFPDFDIVWKECIAPFLAGVTQGSDIRNDFVKTIYEESKQVQWSINNPNERTRRLVARSMISSQVAQEPAIEVVPPTIRAYCSHCENIEPFNFKDGIDVVSDINRVDSSFQVFALTYECQGCKGLPEVFLVRREGLKITLSGRSPIEQVIAAPQIPKSHRQYISDAIVAYNSGQVLAGIFLLRTFIEQYMRSKGSSPNTQDIDALFQEYAAPLPQDFKNRFPSLSSIYETLSIAIHKADPSEQVFLESKEKIEEHFDAKRVFRIGN